MDDETAEAQDLTSECVASDADEQTMAFAADETAEGVEESEA